MTSTLLLVAPAETEGESAWWVIRLEDMAISVPRPYVMWGLRPDRAINGYTYIGGDTE